MQAMGFSGQRERRRPKPEDHRGLEHASGQLAERSNYQVKVMESSPYTKAQMHPMLTSLVAAGAGLTLGAALFSALKKRED
jgi:hypothetical protein